MTEIKVKKSVALSGVPAGNTALSAVFPAGTPESATDFFTLISVMIFYPLSLPSVWSSAFSYS